MDESQRPAQAGARVQTAPGATGPQNGSERVKEPWWRRMFGS
jgi:hypothetical protein